MPTYYTTITDAGQILLAEAMASGQPVSITHFAVGDGGGMPVIPDPAMTTLVNEVYRGGISSLSTSPEQPNAMIAQLIIPKESGGYTVREVALFTEDGAMFSVANYPDQAKPPVDSGYAVKLDLRYHLVVSDTSAITVVISPNDYLTREEADTIYLSIGNNLSEIAANGATAQQAARDNLDLGTAATRDVTTSLTDPTPGRVMLVGDGGILRSTLAVTDADLAVKGGLVSMLFQQGGGSQSIHFGGYGAGVHLMYGNSGDGSQVLSANIFVDSAGNFWSEWIAVDNTTGAVVTERKQKLYGPLNPPPEQTFDAYTKAESDARYLSDVQMGAVVVTNGESYRAPAGHTLTAIIAHNGNYDTQIDAFEAKPIQKTTSSGSFVTVAG